MASLRTIALMVLAATLAGCAARQTTAQRFAAMPPVDDVATSTDWYQPTVVVRGSATTVDPAQPLTPRWFQVADVARLTGSLQVVVLQRGQRVAEWYAPESSPERRYDSQSMHRGLLALVAGAALADGSLESMDVPIGRYLHEWRNDPRGRITVADLMYGRSGFVDPPFELHADNPGLRLFIGEDLLAQLLEVQPVADARPGRGGAIESQLLGIVIERATRQSYARYLSRVLWQPIGASDALVRLDRPGGHTRTLCCLQASARDWARVGQLVLDNGRAGGRQVLPKDWIQRLRTPSPTQPGVSMYWFLKPTPLAPRAFGGELAPATPTPFLRPDVFYAGGRGGLRVYVIPSLQAVVVRLGKLRYDFDDGAFLNPFLEALAP
jgi:CubicO group peptidase (beta-lactamase class C family)